MLSTYITPYSVLFLYIVNHAIKNTSTIPILIHPIHLIQQTQQLIKDNASITNPSNILFLKTLPNDS